MSHLNHRLQKVFAFLEAHSLDGLIIDHLNDLCYLTGQTLSLGRLLISRTAALLLVDGRYFELCQKNAPMPVQLAAQSEIGGIAGFLSLWQKGGRIGFDAHATSYAAYEKLRLWEGELVPLESPIRSIREIKEPDEIVLLRQAAALGSQGYDYICSLFQEGITEEELAIELEIFWKRAKGQKLAFSPHIAFGEHTSRPHHHAGRKPLTKGNVILIDIGVVVDHYHSDMTRAVFYGSPHPVLETIYAIVQEAQQKALECCQPGLPIGQIDRAAREWIAHKGYSDFFPHGTGHGVGLEIHESPVIRATGKDADRLLSPGMVLTVEPGIYLPGIGGIRLEDTIVITETGYENLTKRPLGKSIPIF